MHEGTVMYGNDEPDWICDKIKKNGLVRQLSSHTKQKAPCEIPPLQGLSIFAFLDVATGNVPRSRGNNSWFVAS